MQRHPHDDPYEREPLESSRAQYDNSPPRHPADQGHAYDEYGHGASPYYDHASPRQQDAASTSSSSRSRGRQPTIPDPYAPQGAAIGSRGYADDAGAPAPPRHGDNSYMYNSRAPAPPRGPNDGMYERPSYPGPSNITPGADNFSDTASGGMAGIAYGVADRNARESGLDAMHPPPPSRAQYPNAPRPPYSPHNTGGYLYDPSGNGRGGNIVDRDSHSSLNPFGTPIAASGSHSPARSMRSFAHSEPYADDPYQAYSRNGNANLGVVDPNAIEDDGDDGLHYPRRSQRNSMLSASNSDRGRAAGIGAAAAGGAAVAGGATTAMLASAEGGGGHVYDAGPSREKKTDKRHSKRWRWAIIILVFLIVAGAIVGGVVGSFVAGNKKDAKDNKTGGGGSASDDTKQNGDLDINSSEIKSLMNNPNLHKVFPGMDYTPFNTQYPDCIHNPPSQNNVTRDVAVLSQLTNKIRLYGTDCNQTQMVIHAVNQLKLKDDVKIWLGVWQDGNKTTNARQLEQMWTILDDYGDSYFEGIIVANEVLFREEMTISTLGQIMDNVRSNLTTKKMTLPVATSDLGDDWTAELGKDSDYIMANVHPFFSGVTAEQAAAWTYNFWKEKDGPFWKSDTKKNIISETGWPSAGGKSCGGATSCDKGAVAGIKEMNQFMDDWVCQALANGTNYFWFEAFDEPWKIRFNEKGKEWEDKWGLMDINRKLKDGVKIPDCGGKTVS
ncbi:hypothetical protein ACCO45_009704 [Purpureocillium lilacinum]|uniref:Uncharacterized protein n=1 Tax=Purpureocillium lilacinum TaxID=33203 RepID=A0ACC4DNI5_PURLI